MARLTTAILCDFAQVREQLLFVQSGGISRLLRQTLPAPLGFMLALSLEVEFHERQFVHEIKLTIRDPDGKVILEGTGAVAPLPDMPGIEEGEPVHLPLVHDLRFVGVASYGLHALDVVLDDEPAAHLVFYVREPAPPVQPESA